MDRALITLFLACVISTFSNAQIHFTPGQPWTVVEPNDVPPGAVDTVWLDSLYSIDYSPYELRYIFRVRCHIEAVELDNRKMTIQIPRNPGEVDTVVMKDVFTYNFIDSNRFKSLKYSSSESASHPEWNPTIFEVEQNIYFRDDIHPTESDTVYLAPLIFMPNRNFIIENPLSGVYDEYAYFIQMVDSIWYPAVSTIEAPATALALSAFPNPTRSDFSIQLPEGDFGRRSDLVYRLYDASGKRLVQRRVDIRSLQNLEFPTGVIAGTYTVTLHDSAGQLAVTRVVKAD